MSLKTNLITLLAIGLMTSFSTTGLAHQSTKRHKHDRAESTRGDRVVKRERKERRRQRERRVEETRRDRRHRDPVRRRPPVRPPVPTLVSCLKKDLSGNIVSDNDRRGNKRCIQFSNHEVRNLTSGGTVGLRKAINNKIAGRLGPNAKLVAVTLRGFSTGRMDDVSLRINGSTVDTDYLDRGRRHSRTKVVLANTNRRKESQGRWQLRIDRDAEITGMSVLVRNIDGDIITRPRQVSLGRSFVRTSSYDEANLYPHESDLRSIKIDVKSGSVNIEKVVIHYKNSFRQVEYFSGHTSGLISAGISKTISIDNRHDTIEEIEIHTEPLRRHNLNREVQLIVTGEKSRF